MTNPDWYYYCFTIQFKQIIAHTILQKKKKLQINHKSLVRLYVHFRVFRSKRKDIIYIKL